MYYGLTVRCAGLDGRVNFLISVVAYLADVRRAISVICHNKKLLSFCRQSGAAVSQTRLAVPTFFISKTNIRLMPSHFVPYANVVPPLTPHLAESVPLLCEQPCACRKAAISRGVFNHSPSRLLSFGIRLARLRANPVIEFSQSVMSLRKRLDTNCVRLTPSHFVPYANVVPPLTPHMAKARQSLKPAPKR